MIVEFILGFVLGYAFTPLLRLYIVLRGDKMYEQANEPENGDEEEWWT